MKAGNAVKTPVIAVGTPETSLMKTPGVVHLVSFIGAISSNLEPRLLKLRHLDFLRGDELQQCRLALLRRLDAALDRRDDVGGFLDALAVAAERLGELRIISRDIGRAI